MISEVNREMEACSSLRLLDTCKELSVRTPVIRRPMGLTDEQATGFFQLVTFNFGLGNRAGFKNCDSMISCELCAEYGIEADLNEIHFSLR